MSTVMNGHKSKIRLFSISVLLVAATAIPSHAFCEQNYYKNYYEDCMDNLEEAVIIYDENISFSEAQDICDRSIERDTPEYMQVKSTDKQGIIKWGFIDRGGKLVVSYLFDETKGFKKGSIVDDKKFHMDRAIAPVRIGNKWGYVTILGDNVSMINLNADEADFFYFNQAANIYMARVKINGKYGYINPLGSFVIKPQFDSIERFHGYKYAKVVFNGKTGIIDNSGSYLVKPKFEDVGPFLFNKLLYQPDTLIAIKLNGRWGFIDKYDKIVIAPRFVSVYRFSTGSYALGGVKIGDRWGFVDKKDKLVIPPRFEQAGACSPGPNGLCPVKLGGLWGYIDKQGTMTIKPTYDTAYEFEEGVAKIELNNRYYIIDQSGKVLKEGW